MKVAFDTNVLVSAFATHGLCAELLQEVLTAHQLVVGETVLVELRRVLADKLRLTPELVREVERFLQRQGEVVREAQGMPLPIGDADRKVVAEAVAGGADVLVTGDQALLALGGRAPLPLVSPRELWELLRKRE